MSQQLFPLLLDQSDLYLKNRYFEAGKFLRGKMNEIAEKSELTEWDETLREFKEQVEQTLTMSVEQIRTAVEIAEELKNVEFDVLDFWIVFTIANREVFNMENELVAQYSANFDNEYWLDSSLNCEEDDYEEKAKLDAAVDAAGPAWLQELTSLCDERGVKYAESYVVRQHDNYEFDVDDGDELKFSFKQTYYNKGTFYSVMNNRTTDEIIAAAEHFASTDVNSFDNELVEWEHGDGKAGWQSDFTDEHGQEIISAMIDERGEYEFIQGLIYDEESEHEIDGKVFTISLTGQSQDYTVGNQFLTDEHDYVTGFIVKFADGSTAEVSFDRDRCGIIELKAKQKDIFELLGV
jgi:hypothetical protein